MKILIERFKSIENITLDVNGISLLVGSNNSGKSSVLQAIQFGTSVAQTAEMQRGRWKKGRLSTSIGQNDLVYSPIKDVLSLARDRQLQETAAQSINITYTDEKSTCSISVKKGKNKNISLEIVGEELGKKLQSISSPYSAFVTGLAGVPSEERYVTTYSLRKAAARGDSNSVFRNILYQLKKLPIEWFKFQQQIQRIFPNYEIDVNFEENSLETIGCEVKCAGTKYPIDSCGTGVLQAIQIFSYINLFNPQIMLLDEPDSHLHPNNQKALAKELIRLSSDGLSIIISTHSKHLVEALIDDSTFIWIKKGKLEPITDNYEIKALIDVGALNVGDKISNPQYIFLAEDKNSDNLRLLLIANGYQEGKFEIESYSGCTQIPTAQALIKQLKKSYPKSLITIHRDRDFLSDEELENYSSTFEQHGVKVFIPDLNDIEASFTIPEHISAVCCITIDEAEEIRREAYTRIRDQLLAKYVNSRINSERKAGNKVNEGEISVEGNNLLNGPTSIAVHGKLFAKEIRTVLRERSMPNNIFSSSPNLQIAHLKDMWKKPLPRRKNPPLS